jgi:hypothetical protein
MENQLNPFSNPLTALREKDLCKRKKKHNQRNNKFNKRIITHHTFAQHGNYSRTSRERERKSDICNNEIKYNKNQ